MAEQVSVLGLGNWGTALAQHLAAKGNSVLAWDIADDVREGIKQNGRNPRYQNQIELSKNVQIVDKMEELFVSKTLVLVVPSAALSEVAPKIKLAEGATLVSAIKGFEKASVLTPLQFCKGAMSPCPKLAVVSGPSFAVDVASGRPAGVVAASKDESVASEVAELFSSDSMKVYISTDPLGVELGGILKNTIAVAVGVCDGLELGDSARAGLVTRGLAEMVRLAEKMGAERDTLFGLSGLGDLLMTATCDTSRNRTVGLRLGRGEKIDAIIESLGSVAEGVKTAPLVLQLAKQHGVEMPITKLASEVIAGQSDAGDLVKRLISRPMRREFDEL